MPAHARVESLRGALMYYYVLLGVYWALLLRGVHGACLLRDTSAGGNRGRGAPLGPGRCAAERGAFPPLRHFECPSA